MSAYPVAPNIAQMGGEIAQAPMNQAAEYARVANLNQQTQVEKQQAQNMATQNQIQQQQLADQKAMTAAMHQWDGKDVNQLPELMRQNNISAGGYLQAQQSILQRQQQLAGLSKDQLALMNTHHDVALGALNAAEQVPNEELSEHMMATAQQLQAQGHLAPNEAQQITDHFQSLPPDQARQWVDIYKKGLQAESAQISQAKDQAQTSEATGKGQQAVAEAGKATEQAKAADWEVVPTLGLRVNKVTGESQPIGTGAIMPPAMMEAKYVALAQRKAAGQPISTDDSAFMKGYEKFKTLVPTANINMQAGLLTPQAKEMAGQLYQQTGQLPAGIRSPAMSSQILNQAAGAPGTAVPNIAQNKMQYGTEAAEQKAFTSGSQGQQLTAIGTARNHMATFEQTADALGNGDFLLANRIGQAIGMQFGGDKATNFNIAKTAFAGEVGKAFAGANVGVSDRQELMDKISQASSPAQLKGYAQKADELLAGKQKSLQESYQQGMKGQPNFQTGDSTPKNDFFSQFGGKSRPNQ
jgi:hypothetical protein